MRLVELRPRWTVDTHDPDHARFGLGVTFDCPHCYECRLFVFFREPLDGGLPAAHPRLWHRTGGTFDTLTLYPSIAVVGHWHGYIVRGEVY